MTAQSTAPAPEVKSARGCSNYVHYRLAIDTNIERCPNCDRKLWRRLPQKCERHGVWLCPECFTTEQLSSFESAEIPRTATVNTQVPSAQKFSRTHSSPNQKKAKTMSEVHTTIKSDSSGNAVKFDNPGVASPVRNAGQPVTAQKDASGKTTAASGQVPNTSVVFNSPA